MANKNIQYIVRLEFFGSVIYDRKFFQYYFADQVVTNFLKDNIKSYKSSTTSNNCLPKSICKKLHEINLFPPISDDNYIFLNNKIIPDIFSAPLQVYFDVTTRCHLRCRHCYNSAGESSSGEYTLEEIDELANQLSKMFVFKISIGGGEPLLRDDIFEIIQIFRDKEIDISLSTNGLLLGDSNVVKQLNRLHLRTLTISCEGGNQSTYDAVRGKGIFQRMLQSMKFFSNNYEGRYAMRVTLTSHSCKQVKKIIKLAGELGCYAIKFKFLQMYGRALENFDLVPSKQDYLKAIEEALSMQQYTPVKITVPNHFVHKNINNVVNRYIPLTSTGKYPLSLGFGCSGGKIGAYISPTGNWSPCVSLGQEYDSGNIRETSANEIWHHGKGFIRIRNLVGEEPCQSCDLLEKCKGGCRARAYSICKCITAPDPYCPLVSIYNL